jgi:hypothetical protein
LNDGPVKYSYKKHSMIRGTPELRDKEIHTKKIALYCTCNTTVLVPRLPL